MSDAVRMSGFVARTSTALPGVKPVPTSPTLLTPPKLVTHGVVVAIVAGPAGATLTPRTNADDGAQASQRRNDIRSLTIDEQRTLLLAAHCTVRSLRRADELVDKAQTLGVDIPQTARARS